MMSIIFFLCKLNKHFLLQLNFALCIPSTCSHTELEIVLKENLESFFNHTLIQMDVRVAEDMCQVKDDDKPLSFGTKVSA